MNRDASYFEVEAAVLAGGDSRRMGLDKAWLELGDRPVIENVTLLLGQLFRRVRVIANEPNRFESLNIPVQPDLFPGSGPLGGIHAALSTARGKAVLIVACDFPFLTARFLRGLVSLLDVHDAVVPRPAGWAVPVCAVYSVRCLPAIERRIDRRHLKTNEFLEEVDTRWVVEEDLARLDPDGIALTNLNTPEDYEKAKVIVEANPSILSK